MTVTEAEGLRALGVGEGVQNLRAATAEPEELDTAEQERGPWGGGR